MTPKAEQTWLPAYEYCIVCGIETLSNTCSSTCEEKLQHVSNAIESQKHYEKTTPRGMELSKKTVRNYNLLMDILDRK